MKKVLLIGGGGTLGLYTAKELLRLGHSVDVICLEDHVSDDERQTYYRERRRDRLSLSPPIVTKSEYNSSWAIN